MPRLAHTLSFVMLASTLTVQATVCQSLMQDSSDVRVVTHTSLWSGGVGRFTIEDNPIRSVGADDGDDALWRVGAVERLPTGHLLIAHGGSGELQVYGEDSRIRTLGGSGDGPGEFGVLRWAREVGPGRVIAYDGGNARVSLFDLDDGFVRAWNLVDLAMQGLPVAIDALDSTTVIGYSVFLPRREVGQIIRPWHTLYRIDLGTGRLDSLLSYLGSEIAVTRTPDGKVGMNAPHFRRTSNVRVEGGKIYIADDGAQSINVFDGYGEPILSVRLSSAPRPVTDNELRDLLNSYLANAGPDQNPEGIRGWFRSQPHADRLPAFGDLRIDEDGRIWIERFAPEGVESEWAVLDESGEAICVATLPPTFVLRDIADGRLVGLFTDPDSGVEYVHEYRYSIQ